MIAVLAMMAAVLHLALGALSPLRAAPSFDPFLVLCTHGDGGVETPAPPPARHDHAGDCCLAGCPMGAALPAGAPAFGGERRSTSAAPAPSRFAPWRLDRRPWASPRRTRGPPEPA